MSKRLEEIGRRVGDARERVSKFNRGTFDAMMSALEGDADAQKALRRAFYRSSSPSTYASAVLIMLLAAVASAWLVRRQVDRLDLVAVLKVRE